MNNTCVALLRAANFGGVNAVPMKDFVRLLESMGLRNVQTYKRRRNAKT